MQSQIPPKYKAKKFKSRFLRGCRTYTTEIEGEKVQKTFLRECRTYTTEIEGEEAQKTFLRGCRCDTPVSPRVLP
jgi:hypothetical protein